MKINLQIDKTMIKMNKQWYFVVSFRYSRGSWGVLGALGCPGVIRPTPCAPRQWYWVLCCPFRAIKVHSVSFLTSPVKIDHN